MSASDDQELPPFYQLRLIVAGRNQRSRRAIDNIRRLCDQYLRGRVDLEIVDIHEQPALAQEYQVVALPTLVKLLPLPVRRIIGDLSEQDRVLRGLELATSSESNGHAAPCSFN